MVIIDRSRHTVALTAGLSALILCLLLVARQAALFRMAFPFCAVAVALVLYVKRPPAYLCFVLSMWFTTPLLRRVADLYLGFADQNLILLTPILVTSVCGLTLLERPESAREIRPFVLCMAGVTYGFLVGLILHPSAEVFYGLFNWMVPILLGYHLYARWTELFRYKNVLQNTILWGALLMGIYGIYQYCLPPRWDVYWWESLPYGVVAAFGRPFKYQIRVWSTLNAPAPFAGVMCSALLFNASSRSRLKPLSSLAGLCAFLLTLSRTEWLGWLCGVAFLGYRGKRSSMLRGLAGLALVAILAFFVSSLGSTKDVVMERLNSFSNVSGDDSYLMRVEMYSRLTRDLLIEPFGQGVSNAEVYHGYSLDSGLLSLLYNLGIPGMVLYLAGLIQIGLKVLRAPIVEDRLQVACGAVFIAHTITLLLVSPLFNVIGVTLWLAIGLGLAARKYTSTTVEIGLSRSEITSLDHAMVTA